MLLIVFSIWQSIKAQSHTTLSGLHFREVAWTDTSRGSWARATTKRRAVQTPRTWNHTLSVPGRLWSQQPQQMRPNGPENCENWLAQETFTKCWRSGCASADACQLWCGSCREFRWGAMRVLTCVTASVLTESSPGGLRNYGNLKFQLVQPGNRPLSCWFLDGGW